MENKKNYQEILLEIRKSTGMNRKQFAEYFDIPYMSLSDWERGKGRVPAYLPRLLAYYVRLELLKNNEEEESKEETDD